MRSGGRDPTPTWGVASSCWATSSPAALGCPRPSWRRSRTANCSRLAPFGVADGVVARAVSRLITITSGLDPHGLGVPEMFWMQQSGDYRAAARGFASGTRDGLGGLADHQRRALEDGAREAMSIAEASSG